MAGFWQVIKSHPGKLGGSGHVHAKERLSFMSVPEGRRKQYLKNMGLSQKQMKYSGGIMDSNSFTMNK